MAERRSKRNSRKSAEYLNIFSKKETKAHTKKVGNILKKCIHDRTEDEKVLLHNSGEVVKTIEQRAKVREKLKLRTQEFQDNPGDLSTKCKALSEALQTSKFAVVYTGAGISTAASIPDYRGPNGVWTLLKKGLEPEPVDLSDADPTFTHMAISKLYAEGIVKYVVSQNCDGLHMRSGMPRNSLSELHGNMYLELCKKCNPVREHIRTFDTTERTGLRKHKTGRECHSCGGELTDSIIHFGEKGPFHSPYNWREAAKAADEADVVICLGTSLKVIRRYACLWSMHKPIQKRPKLFIVNLQWTPKDDMATLKINGKCDDVMALVMKHLSFSTQPYKKTIDPIFAYAVPLNSQEKLKVSKKFLNEPDGYNKKCVMNNMKHLTENRVHLELSSDEDEIDVEDVKINDIKNVEKQNTVMAKTTIRKGRGTKATARKSQSGSKQSDRMVVNTSKVFAETDILKIDKDKGSEDDKALKTDPNGFAVDEHEQEKPQINGHSTVNNKRKGRRKSKKKVLNKYIKTDDNVTVKQTPIRKKVFNAVEVPGKSYNFRSSSSSVTEPVKNEPDNKVLAIVVDSHVVDNWFEQHLCDGRVKSRVRYKVKMAQCNKSLPKVTAIKLNQTSDKEKNNKNHTAPKSSELNNTTKRKRSGSTDNRKENFTEIMKPVFSKRRRSNYEECNISKSTCENLDLAKKSTKNESIDKVSVVDSTEETIKKGKNEATNSHRTCVTSPPSIPSTSHNTSSNFNEPIIPNNLNIPGDEALSFLAMEEACELPNLTLDSRKVWACYSSWFTALYQALEQQRDFVGSRHPGIQIHSSVVADPEVVSTAKEQNTVLLANLAVHDMESVDCERDTPSSSICSPVSYSNYTTMRARSTPSCSSNLSSPVQFIDESGSSGHLYLPGSTASMSSLCTKQQQQQQHQQHSYFRGQRASKDSSSVCSSSLSPRQPHHLESQVSVESHNPSRQNSSQGVELSKNPSQTDSTQGAELSNQSSIVTISGDAPCMISNVCSMSSNESEDPQSPTPQQQVQQQPQLTTVINNPVINNINAIGPFVVNSQPLLMTSPLPPISPVLISPPIVVSPIPMVLKPKASTSRRSSSSNIGDAIVIDETETQSSSGTVKRRISVASANSALFSFPEGATGRGQYRSRGRPPNKPGSPVEDPNDDISQLVKRHIANIKEKTATIVENKEHVLQTLGPSAPGWFGKGCRYNNKRRKKSR